MKTDQFISDREGVVAIRGRDFESLPLPVLEKLLSAFQEREHLSPSKWAERYRILAPDQAVPGPWSNEKTPYLIEPMDAFDDPGIEMLVLMSAAQIGKSELIHNVHMWSVDTSPGTTLILYPTERDAKKMINSRLHPAIKGCERIMKRIASPDACLLQDQVRYDSCVAYTAWANSSSSLSSTPCRRVICDEVKDFPPASGKSSEPTELAKSRTKNFIGNRMMMYTSTPLDEDVGIDAMYKQTDRRAFFLRCKHCRMWFFPSYVNRVKWPKGATPDEIAEGFLAWYECPLCHGKHAERDKQDMLHEGMYVPKGVNVLPNGTFDRKPPSRRRSGFWVTGLCSPWFSWSHIAAQDLETRNDPTRLKRRAWWTDSVGFPWKTSLSRLDREHLEKRAKPYELGVAPDWAVAIVAGIDVQHGHFWYVIRCFGKDSRSRIMDYGVLPASMSGSFESNWSPVTDIINRAFPVEGSESEVMPLALAVIDASDRQDEVLQFTRASGGKAMATKGHRESLRSEYRYSSNVPGLLLHRAGSFKDALRGMISRADGERGAWEICEGQMNETYFEHMTAEHKVDRGGGERIWLPKQKGGRHDLWDCERMCILGARILRISWIGSQDHGTRHWRKSIVQHAAERQAARSPAPPGRKGKSFKDAMNERFRR